MSETSFDALMVGVTLGGSIDLPADPDGQNDDRASCAREALDRFVQVTGTDPEDAVADLLADLMHFADRNGVNFNHELKRARWHYHEETRPDPCK